MIQSQLKQIPWLVNKYKRLFFDLDRADIESAAFFALFKASRRYDDTKGIKFGTYADRCIRHEIFQLAKKRGLDTVSLDTPVEGIPDVKIVDTFVVDDFTAHLFNEIQVQEILSLLKDREKKMFVEFFMHGLEQWEIGSRYNLHTNSVHRIIRETKKKIRDNFTH